MASRSDLFVGILPFVRTAEARSFGRAAVSLGVTTAAVSKAVRKLEDELGVRLLDRTSRVVTLTREGELFLERCRQAVLHVQGARDALRDRQREPRGEVAVSLPFILARFVVPNLPRLGAQYPGLSFRMSLSDHIARLADERYDVAIRMGELESSSLVSRLLRRTRWVTVAAPSYLARQRAPRSPDDLLEHNCLRFAATNGKPREWTFREGARSLVVPVRGNLLIDHGDHLQSAAQAGMGVCQVLDFMVQDAIRDGSLVEVLPAFAADGPSIRALSTAARARSPNVRAFTRFLTEAFRA